MIDAQMDITPMIDVTFLLLIFFLVASKVATDSTVKLPPAKNGTAVTTKNAVVLTVAAKDDEAVDVYRGANLDPATKLPSNNARAQELEIRDYVQNEVEENLKKNVLIRADRKVKHREVARLMRAIGQVEGIAIYVAVYEET